MLDLKAARLAQLNAAPRCRRVPIPADLTGDWPAALQEGGFDPQRPAVWLAEGLTLYLTGKQVDHLLGTLGGLAVAGSWLLTDAISHTFLTAPQLAGFRAMMAENGSPFQFGTDDPEGLMAAYGWTSQVTRFGEPGANFGRWIMPEGYHDAPDSPHGYLIVAHR